MSIVTLTELLTRAQHKGYALGYYEAWDQYSLEASLEAAEEMQSPVILGFGGAVTNQTWLDQGGVEELAALARCLAERARVPAAILFNEAQTFEQIQRGLRSGCNTVMLDTSHLPFEDNMQQTRKVVDVAHQSGAAAEAELGQLADAGNPDVVAHGTDPLEAAQFVAVTGVDALAVSIGNVHVLAHGEATVDLQLLERLHLMVPVPLVIHGGTGFPAAAIPAAIERGVAKFNVGTRLKQAYLEGVREAITSVSPQQSIHRIIGSREKDDICNAGKARLKNEIKAYIQRYGSSGRAVSW